MVQNYTEFVQAVEEEYSKLDVVREYLTDAGKGRLAVFIHLVHMVKFADSARSLLEMESYQNLRNRAKATEDNRSEYYRSIEQIHDCLVKIEESEDD